MTAHLRPLDLALVAAYLVGITLFGLRFRKKSGEDKSLRSYFLADNTIPWWAIALSIVSAETSTLTIISIPGVAFAGDFGFLQIVLGYMLGRVVVAALFLPRYFAGEMMTAYQLIDRRFGGGLHKVTAGLFLLTRAAAEGVRVFAVSIVVGIAIGTRDVLSITIISALTLLYTFEGGMAAVIWTDVVQMAIYVGGTVVAILTLGRHIPGGWTTIHDVAGAAGKFHVFHFALNLTTTYTFWAGILGGTFLTMASHGTDQLMVQRMLAARNLRESRLALLSSGVVIFVQFALFLLIGAGLFVFYGLHPAVFASSDRIFPTFIVREMPIGIAGLLVAAILAAAMSNLSAALNSLSSTTVVDFYMHLRPKADDRERAIISKSSTVLWALVLFAIAIYSLKVGGKGHVVEIGLSIASVAYGCLLGVFLLGTLTKFATQTGATIGMVCGFALNLWLWQGTFPVGLFCRGVAHYDGLTGGYGREIGCRIVIPHVAFTWYVLIGALVTFAIGSLFSLVFRKQSARTIVASLLLLFFLSSSKGICFSAYAQTPTPATTPPDFTPISTLLNDAIAAHKLPGAVVLVGHHGKVVFERAYGDRKLAGEPGLDGKPSPAEPMTEDTIFDMASLTKCLATATAVMQLYEQGKIASFDDPVEKYLPEFNDAAEAERQRQGHFPPWVRAELRDKPSRGTKVNAPPDPTRSKVTIRMLLTHTSGEAPDISLRDAWGLTAPNRTEGFFRAETTPLAATPGSRFVYSDINFILLGAIVERLSGMEEDIYAAIHIFNPLGMKETRYLAFDKACGFSKDIPIPLRSDFLNLAAKNDPGIEIDCDNVSWTVPAYRSRSAPTAHDDEGTSATNPDFDNLLRAVVHDPTTRRMGGVAGHAGVFSTAHDISLFASALLEKLLHNTGPFPLKQSTLQLMTQPEQPGHTPSQIPAANAAELASVAAGDKPSQAGLAPHYPAIKGQDLRGFGWDIDTAFSKPRGEVFPIGSFGHTGFTGTSLWMDPASDTYVILLANAIHPRGNPPISNLRGQVATAAARALGLAEIVYQPKDCDGKPDGSPITVEQAAATKLFCNTSGATDCPGVIVCASKVPEVETTSTPDPLNRRISNPNELARKEATKAELKRDYAKWILGGEYCCGLSNDPGRTLTGIDVLESTHFAALASLRHIALFTNQSGIDAHGTRTIDVLTTNRQPLTTLFSPEHGLTTSLDTEHIANSTDPGTGLPIISLYGAHDADRRPTHAQLADLDAVVIDLQDAGVRFWTYEAATSYFLEAAATEQTQYHHDLEIILLDRPNLVGGAATQGPLSDPGTESYVNTMPLPVRHGLTLGELARYYVATHHLATHLTVIPMQHWSRTQYFADTGLPWINPSPNLRSPEAAILYPALGLIETTNISVGRGTSHPFEFFGAGAPPVPTPTGATHTVTASGYAAGQAKGSAGPPTMGGTVTVKSERARAATSKPWFNADSVAAALTARHIPGVMFQATVLPIADDGNNYPYYGQAIPAVHVTVTDRALLDSPELGIEILAVLHRLYPTQFQLAKVQRLLCNQATLDALTRGDDPRDIAATWQTALAAFKKATTPFLLYP